MLVKKSVLMLMAYLMCVWCASAASASGICPESKRRYPGDCRLYYRCVLLPVPTSTAAANHAATTATRSPGVAHAHVWVPTRCTAGLVFNAILKRCVLPDPDWDCRNDDQIIPVFKYPSSTEQPHPPEDYTEDEHLATDRINDLDLIIPHIIEITSNTDHIEEESEMITDNIDRIMSSTSHPTSNSYQSAITRGPYIPVTDVNSPSVDEIATQMDRIADLAHNLKAVTQTEAPSIFKRPTYKPKVPIKTSYTAVSESVATPMTISRPQIPSPAEVNVIINPALAHAHYRPEQHYEVNLLPIQLNKITGQLVHTQQRPISIPAHATFTQQHETNLNFFGSNSNVLKHIVEQSAHRVPASPTDHQNAETLVSALFNKYLANKSFVKKNVTSNPIYTYPYAPVYQTSQRVTAEPVRNNQQEGDILMGHEQDASALANEQMKPRPCVSGVRLPNATDCRRYYMCNASTSAIHTYACPPYTAFDKVRRMCDVAQYARCVNPDLDLENASRKKHAGPTRVQLPPQELCETRDKLQDPTSPQRYVLCVRSHDGRWTRHPMTCPGLLIFCPTRNFCSPKSSCY